MTPPYQGDAIFQSGSTQDLHFNLPSHLYGELPPEIADALLFPNNLLDPLRPFFNGPYSWQAVPVPRGFKQPVPAFGQVEDIVQIPPGSWLVAFAGASTQTAGFRFSIFDKGQNDWCLSDRWMAQGTDAQVAPSVDDQDGIPTVLCPPHAIVTPGQLQVRVVNSASVPNDFQLVLHFAILGGRKK